MKASKEDWGRIHDKARALIKEIEELGAEGSEGNDRNLIILLSDPDLERGAVLVKDPRRMVSLLNNLRDELIGDIAEYIKEMKGSEKKWM